MRSRWGGRVRIVRVRVLHPRGVVSELGIYGPSVSMTDDSPVGCRSRSGTTGGRDEQRDRETHRTSISPGRSGLCGLCCG